MREKVALVTAANKGIGHELARLGFSVLQRRGT
jgi:NAD(P)-dependent dehydrogenase (short-subunit alcohol dehydrogenase family)